MLTLVLSAAAIAVLTGLAWAMGFRSDPVLDDAAARAEVEGRLAGFGAVSVQLAADGRGALVRDAAGRLALILPLGDGWLVRRVPADARLIYTDGVLHVVLGELMLRDVRLAVPRLPVWLEGQVA